MRPLSGETGSVVRLSAPIHGDKPLKTGIREHLSRMAGIREGDLE